MELDKAIKERHSVRSFKKGIKIDYKKIIDIVEAGRYAPAAGNAVCTKYIMVWDKDKIRELGEASQQKFVGDAEWIIVVCSDKQFVKKLYLDRTDKYTKQQAGASIENMLLKAVDLGLASCWIGAFSDEIVRRVLKIPDDVEVEALLPIGKELGKSKDQYKPDPEGIYYFNEWKNKFLEGRKPMTSGANT